METYLSIEGLAKYLGVAEKTVRKWVLNRDIPYHDSALTGISARRRNEQ